MYKSNKKIPYCILLWSHSFVFVVKRDRDRDRDKER